ncbi:MAG: hypothetical protein JXB30_16160 [Anaerolineae bacterium]|nr:hypothetical protein [Anaerolineae bacterium]
MRKATRAVASWLGAVAGIAGLEHGYFEILQGNTRPDGLMIVSMGPPCVPEEAWNACEPAMTVLPSFLISGILSLIIGLLIMVWSAGFVQRKHGGLVLILLSVALLLFGGGLFPPLIGIIGGAAGTQINKPLTGGPGSVTRFAARLWPWPLVVLMVWLLGQFPVGTFFNDFLKSVMYFGLLLILTMLPLSVYTGYAHDAAGQPGEGN